jgi:hypothetical protein
MTRDELVDHIGANAPPASEKPNVDSGARRTAGAKGPPAPPRWIRPVADYDRHEPREGVAIWLMPPCQMKPRSSPRMKPMAYSAFGAAGLLSRYQSCVF